MKQLRGDVLKFPIKTNHSSQKGEMHVRTNVRSDLRRGGNRLWRHFQQVDSGATGRKRAHAGNFQCHPGGRSSLSQPPVHHDLDRRSDPFPGHRPGAGARLADGCRFPDRRSALRCDRLHRHECLGACERANSGGGAPWNRPGTGCCLQGRCDHRHAGGRPGAAWGRRVLRLPEKRRCPRDGH